MQIRSQVLATITLFALMLVFPMRIQARVYGGGIYGNGVYGGADTPAHVDSGSLPIPEAGCAKTPPGSAPWLYGAIAQDSHSILIYFTDSSDPVDHFVLQYGEASGNYQWGASDIGSTGTRTYLVQSLTANTTYHFRVSGANGCASGAWSNDIAATTGKSLLQSGISSTLRVTSLELTPEPLATDAKPQASDAAKLTTPSIEPITYELTIQVVDTAQHPVVGSSVSVDGTTHTTDQNGGVTFRALTAGDYPITVTYREATAESQIYLTGSETSRDLKMVIESKTVTATLMSSRRPMIIGLTLALLGTLGIVIFLFKRRRSKTL